LTENHKEIKDKVPTYSGTTTTINLTKIYI